MRQHGARLIKPADVSRTLHHCRLRTKRGKIILRAMLPGLAQRIDDQLSACLGQRQRLPLQPARSQRLRSAPRAAPVHRRAGFTGNLLQQRIRRIHQQKPILFPADKPCLRKRAEQRVLLYIIAAAANSVAHQQRAPLRKAHKPAPACQKHRLPRPIAQRNGRHTRHVISIRALEVRSPPMYTS